MLLTIAIISLISYLLIMILTIIGQPNKIQISLGLGSIMVISWWTISLTMGIILLVYVVIWTLIGIGNNSQYL